MNDTSGASGQSAAGCMVCGRRDETVRYVSYPYVFSVVLVTFQRAFSGCWCRVHRIQRWLAASLITLIFGWFGFPFGLIFTPIRLFQLAKGGLQNDSANADLLVAIADEKLRGGDSLTALRCLETSLMYRNDVSVRERAMGLKAYQSQRSDIPGIYNLFVIPLLVLVAVVLGFLIGTLEYGSVSILSSLVPEISFTALLLTKLPLLITIYFSVVLLGIGLRWAIGMTNGGSRLLAYSAGSFLAVCFSYSIAGGEALGRYIEFLLYGIGFESNVNDYLINIVLIFLRGGLYYVKLALSGGEAWGYLFVAIIFLTLVFALGVISPMADKVVRQKLRLENVSQVNAQMLGESFQWGLLGLASLLIIPIFLFFAVPQKTTVDVLVAVDHYIAGLNQAQAGDSAAAILEYEQALDIKPDLLTARLALGYSYLFSGERAKARESFSYILTLAPETQEAHAGMGWAYLQEGDTSLADKEFRETLRINPQNLDAILGLGWVYLGQLKIDDSNRQFQRAIELSPDIPNGYLGLGVLNIFTNDFEKAIDFLDTALGLDSTLADAYLYKGTIYFRQDKYPEAEGAYQAVLKLQPDNYDAISGLGEIRIARYEFEEGFEYFDRAIELNPDKIDAPWSKISALIQTGRFKEAVSIIDSVSDENETLRPTLAYVYYQLNRNEEADLALQEAISHVDELDNIERRRAYTSIGLVYASMNRYPDARKYLEYARNSSPLELDADSQLSLSYILSSLGEFDDAEKAIREAGLIGHSELSWHMAKASLLIDQEDLAGAQKEVQAALRIDKDSARAHALFAFIYYQQNQLTLSIEEAKRAIELNPYNSYAYTQLAFAYQASGRTDEALVAAQESVRLDSLYNASHFILGVCYMEKGMKTEAIAQFEKFLGNYWERAYIRDYKVKAEEYLVTLKQAP